MAAEDCFYCSRLDIGSKIPNLFLNIFQNQVIARTHDPLCLQSGRIQQTSVSPSGFLFAK